jgi:putative ABC transport system permease protein
MSVSERTREIGTLRAVGWSRTMVLALIIREGLIISIIGGICGLALGAAGAEILIRLVPPGFLSTSYNIVIFVEGMAVAVLVGFVGSIYPASVATRFSPAEALRYE